MKIWFCQRLRTLFAETEAPEAKAWAGPQCFETTAGVTMLALHILEATPHRRLT